MSKQELKVKYSLRPDGNLAIKKIALFGELFLADEVPANLGVGASQPVKIQSPFGARTQTPAANDDAAIFDKMVTKVAADRFVRDVGDGTTNDDVVKPFAGQFGRQLI